MVTLHIHSIQKLQQQIENRNLNKNQKHFNKIHLYLLLYMSSMTKSLQGEVFFPNAPQVDNNTYYYNEKTGKYYFKAFLMNNLVNKRKFRVSNIENLHRDVDGYENLPLTLVEDGFRKGNHPNPKDANIFEANYPNKYSYVTNAINYYWKFGVAKILKIFKPDSNMLAASAKNPGENILNYYAFLETEHPKMIKLLEESKQNNTPIYVSPAMYSSDWNKDQTGQVNVNSFIPTHLAIVDKPAYDPEIAYIKKETCQKDGTTCYYELLEASELENLNNNNPQQNNMSANNTTNPVPISLEDYIRSYYGYDLVDAKSINAEELVKNIGNLMIIDKNKVLTNKSKSPEPQPQPIPVASTEEAKAVPIPTKVEPAKAVPLKAEPAPEPQPQPEPKKESKSNFTLDDVKALLEEQKKNILAELKAEQTKGEREQLLDTYFNNNGVKEVKDKIDQEKLKNARELYNAMPYDNTQLKAILDNSIYNPQIANPSLYTSVLALSEANRAIDQTEPSNKKNEPIKQVTETKKVTVPNTNTEPITNIPPKSMPNINTYGTEFKNSSDSTNKYNDNYKSKSTSATFEASKTGTATNDNRPVPITGEEIPKKFQKYIQ